jgi:hypothetical protein
MMTFTAPLILLLALNLNDNKHDVPIRSDDYRTNNSIGNNGAVNTDEDLSLSRWQRRTAKRRQRTEEMLHYIEAGGLPPLHISTFSSAASKSLLARVNCDMTPTLTIPQSSNICWDEIHPTLDPITGGKIGNENKCANKNRRGLRKRGQIQAFHFILSSILNTCYVKPCRFGGVGVTIIDAGCGAGNLAIALAGLLQFSSYNANNTNFINLNILAVDVNNEALNQLSRRVAPSTSESAQQLLPSQTTLMTCCSDLADYEYILSHIPSHHDVIVVSLHACGAASDMAMNLAYICNNAPFVICPCCTAKSLTMRDVNLISSERGNIKNADKLSKSQIIVNPQASHYRSGATADIQYPRSHWLKTKLSSSSSFVANSRDDDGFALLAKVADVGLGPQTPTQQREQQRRAKRIIEFDRLMSASERQHGYDTRLMRIDDQDEDPQVYSYGKGEILLGALKGSLAAKVLMRLPSFSSSSS